VGELLLSLRVFVSLLVGKFLIRLLRLLRRAGTTLPGRVALAIAPGLVERVSASVRISRALVTGTNGKTTTAALFESILNTSDLKTIRNVSGANMLPGLASVLVEHSNFRGMIDRDVLVAEVDEATMPMALPQISPDLIIVTNFFRDQLDRYGELDHIVALVRSSLAHARGVVCLNGDDPQAARLVDDLPSGVKPVLFGFDQGSDTGTVAPSTAEGVDVQFCPDCGSRLGYHHITYAHLGSYFCSHCGWDRPRLDVVGTIISEHGLTGARMQIEFGDIEEQIDVSLRVPGAYNAYNALAAASAARALHQDPEAIRTGIEEFSGAFGRMEKVSLPEGDLLLALVKNPVGFNEVLRTVQASEGDKVLLLAINDHLADGTDISWLWDVDFGRFADREDVHFVVSGRRAEDMAVRLKYAGVSQDRMQVCPDLEESVSKALHRSQNKASVYVLPTYTAMLELRGIMARQGLVRRMWEG